MAKSNFREFLEKVDVERPYTVATKGINSGEAGNGYEVAVKLYLNTTRGKLISKQGRSDFRKKVGGVIKSFEIKNGSGDVGYYKEGQPVLTVCKSDYLIYCPRYQGENVELISYVVPMQDFLTLWLFSEAYGHKNIRIGKLTRNGTKKISMQTVYDPKRPNAKMYTDMLQFLSNYPTLAEFFGE